jgi:peptide/nickel transport system substrate-binding protein
MQSAAASIAALSLIASACGSGGSVTKVASQDAETASSSPVTIATDLAIASLDPTNSTDTEELQTVFDPLVGVNASAGVVPDLATSWTVNSTGTVWTFNIRHGVHFQNGSLLTPSDVTFTVNQIISNPKSIVQSYVANIKSVANLGAHQVVFTLKEPDAGFLADDVSFIYIVPEAAYKSMGATRFALHPVGTGPYEVTKMTSGISLTLKAFPNYWDGPAKIKNVTYEYIADETTRINGIQSGSVNAAVVSTEGAQALGATSGVVLRKSVSGKTAYLGLDVRTAPLESLDLRRAISDAIDRSALTDALLAHGGTPTDQMLAPPVLGYDAAIKTPSQDLTKAKALVKASGYSGQVIPFEYPVGSYVAQGSEVAQAVAADLSGIGIKTSLVALQFSTFLSDFFGKSLQGISLFAFATNTAASEYQLLDSAAPFDDARVDALFTQQAATTNASKRLKLLQAIDLEYNKQAYFVPLYAVINTYVTTKHLSIVPRVDGQLLPYEMGYVS